MTHLAHYGKQRDNQSADSTFFESLKVHTKLDRKESEFRRLKVCAEG